MIQIAIGTVRERADSLAAVVSRLQITPRIYLDEPRSGGSWLNMRRALIDTRGDGWLVLLDDDVWPCDNFVAEAERCLSSCPGVVASLFWGLRPSAVKEARRVGASWIESAYHIYGAACAVRAELASDCAEWCDAHVNPVCKAGDGNIARWAASTWRRIFSSVPSLVQHRPDVASILKAGRRNDYFQADFYVENPSGVSWNSRVVSYGNSADDYLARQRAAGLITA